MVVDPQQLEKGVFTAFFKIPTSCSCSIVPEHENLGGQTIKESWTKKTSNKSTHWKSKKQNSFPRNDHGYNYGNGSYFTDDEETTTLSGILGIF